MLSVSFLYATALPFSTTTSTVLAVYVISLLPDESEPSNHSAFSKEPGYVHGINTLHVDAAEMSPNWLIPE
jgi:hypothetical protein